MLYSSLSDHCDNIMCNNFYILFLSLILVYYYYLSYNSLKSQCLKEERLLLLEAWRDMEASALQTLQQQSQASGDSTSAVPSREFLSAVEARFPRKIKMVRTVYSDGTTSSIASTDSSSAASSASDTAAVAVGTEDYFEYVFPDDEKKIGKLVRIYRYVCIL